MRDHRSHEGHRLSAEKLARKLATVQSLRKAMAVVSNPRGAAQLVELSNLCAVELSDRIAPTELDVLRARRGLNIRLFPYVSGTRE